RRNRRFRFRRNRSERQLEIHGQEERNLPVYLHPASHHEGHPDRKVRRRLGVSRGCLVVLLRGRCAASATCPARFNEQSSIRIPPARKPTRAIRAVARERGGRT